MSKLISKATTPEAKAIWEGMSKVAESAPPWMKERIEKAATESAKRIIAKWKSEQPLGF